MTEQRGLHNWKNLFKLDRRDLYWTVFFLFIFIMAYGYVKETGSCKDILNNPCPHMANFTDFCTRQENIKQVQTNMMDWMDNVNITPIQNEK